MERIGILAIALALGCSTVEPDDPYSTAPYSTSLTSVGTEPADTSGTSESSTTDDVTAADTTTFGCVGAEGCPCTPGGGCDPSLKCLSEVCVDPGPLCPVGSQGCPCTVELTCDDAELECVSNECVPEP